MLWALFAALLGWVALFALRLERESAALEDLLKERAK